MDTLTDEIAEFVVSTSIDDVPDEAIAAAKHRLVDSLGIAVRSHTTEPVKALRGLYGDLSPSGASATIIGTGIETEPAYAGLINSAMVRYLDYNDAYISPVGGCHPSDHVGTLLAVAEAESATGAELLEAMVIAYEIQCRGMDTGAMWTKGFDYVTWGAYATAAAGKLMGLDREELRHAIGIAATSNNGILAARMGEVSMWKGLAQPYAQHNAHQACQMARRGVTGPVDAFEVANGGVFESVTGKRFDLDLTAAGPDYKIEESAIKLYPCGYGAHPAVHSVLKFRRSHDVDPDDIDSIDVRTVTPMAEIYTTPERWDPEQSRESADHSIPYCVAVALVDGEVTLRQFQEDRLRDPDVHATMEKITAGADEEMDSIRESDPSHFPSEVTIVVGADTYELRAGTAPGHPDDPMSDRRLEAKFHDLTGPYLTDAQRTTVLSECEGIRDVDDVSVILDALVV